MDDGLEPVDRETVINYVLDAVYPDRLEAEVVDSAATNDGWLVGVKVLPRGYVSTAKYALVTLDESGQVVDDRQCTRRELRRHFS